ncbi:DUF6668 family protein [Dermabacteraceae bacterium P13147]
MISANPFLRSASGKSDALLQTESAEMVAEKADEVLGSSDVFLTGPPLPLLREQKASPPAELPLGASPAAAKPILVSGVHGGAGASLVATLLGDVAAEYERSWPVPSPWVSADASSVLLVARTHGRGLDALDAALQAWHRDAYAEGVPLLGVMVVDDGPKLSKAQRARVRALTRMAPTGWRLPWTNELRYDAHEYVASGHIKRVLASIRKKAGTPLK